MTQEFLFAAFSLEFMFMLSATTKPLCTGSSSFTSLRSGASSGSAATISEYQLPAEPAEIPWAKILMRTIVITARFIVSSPGIPFASSTAMSNRTTDASPLGPDQPRKMTVSRCSFVPIREIPTGTIPLKKPPRIRFLPPYQPQARR